MTHEMTAELKERLHYSAIWFLEKGEHSPLTDEEMAFLLQSAKNYVGDSTQYRAYVHGPRKIDDNQEDLDFSDNDFDEGEV